MDLERAEILRKRWTRAKGFPGPSKGQSQAKLLPQRPAGARCRRYLYRCNGKYEGLKAQAAGRLIIEVWLQT